MMSIVSVSLALLFLIKLHCGASVNTINYQIYQDGEDNKFIVLHALWLVRQIHSYFNIHLYNSVIFLIQRCAQVEIK